MAPFSVLFPFYFIWLIYGPPEFICTYIFLFVHFMFILFPRWWRVAATDDIAAGGLAGLQRSKRAGMAYARLAEKKNENN